VSECDRGARRRIVGCRTGGITYNPSTAALRVQRPWRRTVRRRFAIAVL